MSELESLLMEAELLYGHLLPPQFPASDRQRLHALLTVRPPGQPRLSPVFMTGLSGLLKAELQQKGGPVDPSLLETTLTLAGTRICLWQGDITRLACDAIVNAANDQMLGCFQPEHRCIDNVIHGAAGPELREACASAIATWPQSNLPVGSAEITQAHELPARFVIHTVGPRMAPCAEEEPPEHQKARLAACYESCLDKAAAHGCRSVAFCCISTGLFCFPKKPAAAIAIKSVLEWLTAHEGQLDIVVFDVFLSEDLAVYMDLVKHLSLCDMITMM